MSESGRLQTVRTVDELRAAVRYWRAAGDTIGLVPTMGALHRGHISLIGAARAVCRRCIATIFVNPKQFGPSEDFERYPRSEDQDRAKLDAAGCDLLFAPDLAEMYPDGFATTVWVAVITERWEGEARPGHFAGVATVVAKLLLQAGADKAFFGEKDFQQLRVVTRLARDLDLATEIVGCATIREADGLALSSRNVYLSPAERRAAPALFRALTAIARRAESGGDVETTIARKRSELLAAGFSSIDYLALVDADTLEPLAALDRPGRVLGAARLGAVRLIDNVAAFPQGLPTTPPLRAV
jgi:pantoate--beta-alanine ligase